MADLVNAPMVAFGAALLTGVWLVICGLLLRPVRLDDALVVVSGKLKAASLHGCADRFKA